MAKSRSRKGRPNQWHVCPECNKEVGNYPAYSRHLEAHIAESRRELSEQDTKLGEWKALARQRLHSYNRMTFMHLKAQERESVANDRIAELEKALEVSEIKNDLLNKMCERNEKEIDALKDTPNDTN